MEDLTSIFRIGDNRRIILGTERRPINTDQPILAAYFPVIGSGVAVMPDQGKQAFRAWTIASYSRRLRDGHEILRAGKQEGVALGERPALTKVAWNPSGRLPAYAGDAQPPPQAEKAVPVACAVDEIELRLKSIAPRRQRDWNREVARARVEIR